ncbi:hypothetical protein LINGRAHAP2_LOCUS31309 [Linum grandiflorum]
MTLLKSIKGKIPPLLVWLIQKTNLILPLMIWTFEIFLSQRQKAKTSSYKYELDPYLSEDIISRTSALIYYSGGNKIVPSIQLCETLQKIFWLFLYPLLHLNMLLARVVVC